MVPQFLSLSLADQKTMLAVLKQEHAQAKARAKATREADKAAKAQAKADKQAAAIVKAQARLQKLLEKQAKPVGTKALKAARRPSKAVVTYGAEANQIASAIMAKKASA